MSNQDLQEVSASANICLDYSQLNFCTNSNCHIIITHLNSFLSCFILIFLLLRCTAAKLPKEQTGQRNCCCYCRYTGPHIQQQQVGPKVSLFKFQDLGVWPEPASPGIIQCRRKVWKNSRAISSTMCYKVNCFVYIYCQQLGLHSLHPHFRRHCRIENASALRGAALQGWRKRGGSGGGGARPPDFGIIEDASGQPHYYLPTQIFRRCAIHVGRYQTGL